MLQRMQAEIGELFRLRMRVDPDHPALFTKFVDRKHLAMAFVSKKAELLGDLQDDKSASPASGSVRNAFSSAPSYHSCSSAIDAETTLWPSSLISSRSDVVSPIVSAE